MKIRAVAHKSLRRFYEDGIAKGIPAGCQDKLRKMLAFLDDMEHPDELGMLPSWKAHLLTGDRRGTWSLRVTANWRLTFRIDPREHEIYHVDLEDYH